MGLDMFAGKTRKDVVDNTAVPIMEWRKHPNLHGYMQALYASRSGCKDPMKFNKKPLFLSRQDLEDLRQAVLSGQLPKTEGHFFGESLPEEQHFDLIFIDGACRLIDQGWNVFYDSWW